MSEDDVTPQFDRNGTEAVARLSGRQMEVLRLVGQGFSSKEIARSLGLSSHTVDSHIASTIQRLGVEDRRAAARLFASVERATGHAPSNTHEGIPSDWGGEALGIGKETRSPDNLITGDDEAASGSPPNISNRERRFGGGRSGGDRRGRSPNGMRDVVIRYILDALYVALFFLVMSSLAYGLDRLVELAKNQHIDPFVHIILRAVAIALAAIDGIGVVVAGSLLTFRFIKELLLETA